jgi:hypothetical protein
MLQVVTCPHQKPLAPIVAFRRWIAKAIANASTRKIEQRSKLRLLLPACERPILVSPISREGSGSAK